MIASLQLPRAKSFRFFRYAVAAVITLGLAVAHVRADDSTGISTSEVLMGQSVPYSGPVSSAGANGTGDLAFMKMLNDQGSIHGRKFKLISLDDGYSPPKTLELTRKMVEQDKVAFLYSTLGTAPISAIAKYLTERKIPHLLINSGSDKFYDSKEYPTFVPYFPRYTYQAEVLARWILAEKPNAKIAFLYQNDDLGRNFLDGVRAKLGDKASNIVKEVSFEIRDPSVDSQVISLAESKADILFIASSPGRAISQAIRKSVDIGWKPTVMLPPISNAIDAILKPGGLDNAVGTISATFMKDPSDETLQDDPEIKAWNAWMDKYNPGADKRNNAFWFPYLKGWIFKAIMERAGENPTRESILKTATSLPKIRVPLMLDGVTIEGIPELRTMNIVRFDGKRWVPLGKPITAGEK